MKLKGFTTSILKLHRRTSLFSRGPLERGCRRFVRLTHGGSHPFHHPGISRPYRHDCIRLEIRDISRTRVQDVSPAGRHPKRLRICARLPLSRFAKASSRPHAQLQQYLASAVRCRGRLGESQFECALCSLGQSWRAQCERLEPGDCHLAAWHAGWKCRRAMGGLADRHLDNADIASFNPSRNQQACSPRREHADSQPPTSKHCLSSLAPRPRTFT